MTPDGQNVLSAVRGSLNGRFLRALGSGVDVILSIRDRVPLPRVVTALGSAIRG